MKLLRTALFSTSFVGVVSASWATEADGVEELIELSAMSQKLCSAKACSLHQLALTYFERMGCPGGETAGRLCTNDSTKHSAFIASIAHKRRPNDTAAKSYIEEVVFTLRPWRLSISPVKAFEMLRDHWGGDEFPAIGEQPECSLSRVAKDAANWGRSPLTISFTTEGSLCVKPIQTVSFSIKVH